MLDWLQSCLHCWNNWNNFYKHHASSREWHSSLYNLISKYQQRVYGLFNLTNFFSIDFVWINSIVNPEEHAKYKAKPQQVDDCVDYDGSGGRQSTQNMNRWAKTLILFLRNCFGSFLCNGCMILVDGHHVLKKICCLTCQGQWMEMISMHQPGRMKQCQPHGWTLKCDC